MRLFIKYIFVLTVFFSNLFIFNAKANTYPTKLTNLVVFVRFNGEEEFIGNNEFLEFTLKDGVKTELRSVKTYDVLENTYNTSPYSLKNYWYSVSNQNVEIENVFLFKEPNSYTTITLENTRGYYSPYNENTNPDGYKTLDEQKIRDIRWQEDFTSAINNTFKNGGYPSKFDGTKLPLYSLDSNNDGKIDCISVVFQASSQYSIHTGDILWGYQYSSTRNETQGIVIKDEKGNTLEGGKLNQYGISIDPISVYRDQDTGGRSIYNVSIPIHEMGHILGFGDLYSYENINGLAPVGKMSAMSYVNSPVPQFLLGREREVMGWLSNENIKEIAVDGTYNISPTRDSQQKDTILYKLRIPSNQDSWLYLEYRNTNNTNINRFNSNSPLLWHRNGDAFSQRNDSNGLLVYVVQNGTSQYIPSNGWQKNGLWDIEVLGGNNKNRTDSPLNLSLKSLTYKGINISVEDINDDTLRFKIIGINNEDKTIFNDVPNSHWAADSIKFVVEKGIFSGINKDLFSPNTNMKRKYMWVVLSKLKGMNLKNVTEVTNWAISNNITDGSNPNGDITREQFIALLWRISGEPKTSYDITFYKDYNSISKYAREAMAWAIEYGIVSGTSSTTLSPKNTATRSEIAAMVSRYIEYR